MNELRSRRVAASMLVAVLFCTAVPATASADTAELSYDKEDGTEACPDAWALRDGVAARLGYNPFEQDSDRHVRVTLGIDRSEQRLTARIEITSPDREEPGVRNLSSSDPSCEKLARALIFTVSVAIDPGSAMGGPARDERPEADRRALMAAVVRVHDAHAKADRAQASAEPAPEPAPEPDEPDVDESTESSDSSANPVSLRAGAGGGLAAGTAPRPTGLFRLGAEFARDRWSMRLDGRMELPGRQPVADGNVETSLALAELAVCGNIDIAFGCAVGGIGRVRLTGIDLAESYSGTKLYAATGARLGADIPLSTRFTWRLQGQLLATLVRTRAVVDSRTVWTTPDFSGSLGTMVVVQF